jgi:hypothetical protein
MANRTDGSINRFSIDQFTSKIKVGLITPSNFFVKFTPPGTISGFSNTPRYTDVALFCAATSLPGRRLATTEQRPYGFGNVIKMPYDVMQDDIDLTFYVDAQYATSLDFFTRWMNSIIDPSEGFPDNGNKGHRVRYKGGDSKYTTDIRIFVVSQLEGSENPAEGTNRNASTDTEVGYAIIECKLVDAYPIQISPIALDWGDGDQFIRVNVTFAYRTAVYSFGEYSEVSNIWGPSTIDVGEREYLQERQKMADLLTSTADFIGSVRKTSQQIFQYKTTWNSIRNLSKNPINNLSSLVPLFGSSPELQLINRIVTDARFVKSVFKQP